MFPLSESAFYRHTAQYHLHRSGEGSDGATRIAHELAERHPDLYFYADQYSNDANWRAHYHTTANEIWKQTEGRVTHFVSIMGQLELSSAPPGV